MQIDLEQPADIYAVVIWHYHAEGRVYHDVIVQVSDDPDFTKGVKTVFNNDFDNSSGLGAGQELEYIDDYRGKLIDAKDEKGQPVRGRYVRLYSNGNTSNDRTTTSKSKSTASRRRERHPRPAGGQAHLWAAGRWCDARR